MSRAPGAAVELSLVIPAYDEEARLPASLREIAAYLASRPALSTEVLVVDDGSRDATAARAEEEAKSLGLSLRVLRLPENRGKGAAVRAGALAAAGASVLVTDADLSAPIAEWEKLAAADAPVAIGSRALDRRLIRVRQPLARELMGRLFNVFVRAVALPGIRDTQCGFKLFSRAAARDVFSRATVDRFAWDVEALLLARRLGHRVAEVPVVWLHKEDSRVGLLKGAQAYGEVLSIRRRVRKALREALKG